MKTTPLSLRMTPIWLCALAAAGGCGGASPAANPVGTGGAGYPVGTGGDGGMTNPAGTGGAGGMINPGGTGGVVSVLDPGSAVTLTVPAQRAAALTVQLAAVDEGAPTDAAAFSQRWTPTTVAALGYDPMKALRLDAVQASHLKLNDGELALLGKNGFAISARQAFSSFFLGYKAIYVDDLPVFISADSILHAVHRSFDSILTNIELASLIQATDDLLRGMHQTLAAGGASGLSATARADADLYLTVARQLLQPLPYGTTAAPTGIAPVAGASAAQIGDIVDKAVAATELVKIPLFGDPGRAVDFTQFKPRGHYVGDHRLEAYFRAMIWLGRTDLRIIVYDGHGSLFNRRQFEASLALAVLLDDARRNAWASIDDTLRAFVGESDNMTVADFQKLQAAVGAATIEDLVKQDDQTLAQAINDGGFGIQRIASQILFVPPDGLNAPLDRAFLLFGQRYILDSEVLSNVVFDRVLPGTREKRMLPDPLDVAFAALGNTHAAPLLAADLAAHDNYPRALHRARILADAHEPAFWNGSLYHAWLGAIRGMSPPADLTGAAGQGLPAVARTEAWSRRVLNAQLGSWAELRHDTLLYAKQSYTSFPVCEYPDAYVDPYPELWAGLGRYAARGLAVIDKIPAAERPYLTSYFTELATVAARLEDMARRQLTGVPFSAEQLAWVNEAVTTKTMSLGCVQAEVPEGWYVRLFYNAIDVTKTVPTVADVHTNPGDQQVLHVATGVPRLMVMTAETCAGPRAYVGLASSYFEKTTTGLQRLTDEDWGQLLQTHPPEARWMKDLVAP